jgi:signal recognition particle subunit SRP54
MFENLSDKLQRSFKTLRGQGTISDENIADALREIRLALLESDVNLAVVTELIDHIRTRALGEKVVTALSPSEQIVKIVHDELINVLGRDTARFQKASQPPSVILMAGLQGSGKTTTSGKLAIVARSTNSQIYEGKITEANPGTEAVLRLAREAKREAANYGCDMLIVDTAGRNQIDAALMDEMAQLKKLLNPSEILFVADAMTGQDAVNSAKAFNDLLTITGAILTKMDGDARGGAALSIRHVTGAPIKFLGTGEKPDAFEPFHPDRIVSRIMGHGDIATLIERAEEKLDRGKAEQFAKKALSGDGFSLEDFRDQLRQIKKMGSMKSILKMLPSVGPFAGMQQAVENVDEGQFTRVESIINSMTKKERLDHEIINGNRRKRIARGSGTTVQDVNNLLRQYAQMRKMFKSMGSGGGIKAQQRLMSQMQGRQKFGR